MKNLFIRNPYLVVILLLVVVLVGCTPTPESEPVREELPTATAPPLPTEVPTPVEVIELEDPIEPIEEEELVPEIEEIDIPDDEIDVEDTRIALAADPIIQQFVASDGETLTGTFYPADTVDAPVIVLLHWMLGDQNDWQVIAPWLQNRGLVVEGVDDTIKWKDASWFPDIPDDQSFNVFTFTFRGCEGRCPGFNREAWLLDVEAVANHIPQLENVNPEQVVMIGASIGADGAANACDFYNRDHGGCLGAFSLSPGGYLTIPYPESVASLEQARPAALAWCLVGEEDVPSMAACRGIEAENYQIFGYPGFEHGMEIIKADLEPNALVVLLQFLHDTGLCENCQ